MQLWRKRDPHLISRDTGDWDPEKHIGFSDLSDRIRVSDNPCNSCNFWICNIHFASIWILISVQTWIVLGFYLIHFKIENNFLRKKYDVVRT